jgi:hypothetical protein
VSVGLNGRNLYAGCQNDGCKPSYGIQKKLESRVKVLGNTRHQGSVDFNGSNSFAGSQINDHDASQNC